MNTSEIKNWDVVCSDSIEWFSTMPTGSVANVLTGLPDMNEIQSPSIDEYLKFFRNMSELIFTRLQKNGYAIFIQTDRKIDGRTVDKSYHLTDVATKLGLKLVWHKIVLQRDVGKIDLHRPTYSHVLCYTYTGKPGSAFEDVFSVSEKLYENATPRNACFRCAEYIKTVSKSQKNDICPYDVVDPFVGRGTAGMACIQNNLSFLGIDIDKNQCIESKKILSNFENSLPKISIPTLTTEPEAKPEIKKLKIKLNMNLNMNTNTE